MSKRILKKQPYYIYETVRQPQTGGEHTYGIKVTSDGMLIAFTPNVSTDRQAVQRLTNLCTKEQLDPIHLNDVIEDFLLEKSTI